MYILGLSDYLKKTVQGRDTRKQSNSATSTASGKSPAKRSLNPDHVKKHGYLAKRIHYSESSEKLFCPTKWIVTGYDDWRNLVNIKDKKGISCHVNSPAQRSCLGKADDFICVMTGKSKNDTARFLNKQGADQVDENTQFIGTVIDVMKFFGGQGIPPRGHREIYDLADPHKNYGNFLALLDVIAKYDETAQKNH